MAPNQRCRSYIQDVEDSHYTYLFRIHRITIIHREHSGHWRPMKRALLDANIGAPR